MKKQEFNGEINSLNNNEEEKTQIYPKLQLGWKAFYRWLQTEIVEQDGLKIRLRYNQKVNYPNLTENALNRFVDSLEATLDSSSFFHLFPTYDDSLSFEELFNLNLIFCGKKTEKKRIGEVSYADLKKLFCDWKKDLKISQEKSSQNEQVVSENEKGKEVTSQENNKKVKNILLIGRTGSGKSTLANVLVNKNEEFTEVFKESARSISQTKNIQTERFTINISEDGKEKVNYLVIDTIGFGDTKLNNKEVLELLQDLVPIIGKSGLNQVLFVTDGRFTEREIDTYKLLESVIFDKDVVNYTTIIRARFPEFEDRETCEEDTKELRAENSEVFKILKASKIIYVDNPPLIGRSLGKVKEIREESRKRLLTYLATCQDIYCPNNLVEFSQRIDDYKDKNDQLEEQLREKERVVQEQEEKLQSDIMAVHTKQQIDSELNRRKFEQKIKNVQNSHDYKLNYTQEQLQSKYQS